MFSGREDIIVALLDTFLKSKSSVIFKSRWEKVFLNMIFMVALVT